MGFQVLKTLFIHFFRSITFLQAKHRHSLAAYLFRHFQALGKPLLQRSYDIRVDVCSSYNVIRATARREAGGLNHQLTAYLTVNTYDVTYSLTG